MIRRRWPGGDRGAFTAELAAGLPALMLLLIAALTAVDAVATKGRCIDAARTGALAAARGEDGPAAAARVAPAEATVTVASAGETVTVVVRCSVRVLTVEASAVAALEPGAA